MTALLEQGLGMGFLEISGAEFGPTGICAAIASTGTRDL